MPRRAGVVAPGYSSVFPIPEKTIANDDGVLVEKSMSGQKYMDTERTTFVVGRDGRITRILRKVKPEAHVEQLRATLL